MPLYLISFDDGAMDHITGEELPDVGKAAHAVSQEAMDAGVWVFGGGLERQRASIVATDGVVTDGPYPETKEVIGGLVVVDVPSREEALVWAAVRRRLPLRAGGTGDHGRHRTGRDAPAGRKAGTATFAVMAGRCV
ncbi:YciI family protein [Luedemannella flava]